MIAKNIVGVYKITNKLNNKIYIGSSVNCKGRWSVHKCKASDQYISRAMKKYGVENFIFEIIETCEIEQLREREQYWLDHFKSYDREIGYNIGICAERPMFKVEVSEETRKFRSELGKTWVGDKNPFFGKTHTEETKKAISEALKGKSAGENNPNYGKKHSPEALKKISEASMGRDTKTGRKVKQIDIETGEVIKIWDSISQAALALSGKKRSHISTVCSGNYNDKYKLKKCLGYGWEYAD